MTDSSWTAGYVSDLNYTMGYYGELNPLHARLSLLSKGHRFPDIVNACELGFGQGISLAMHATSPKSSWFGTDFNPSQAVFAWDLIRQDTCNAHISDDSFEEYLARDDLPQFDFICLHGIWSWISRENRELIKQFIRRKLNIGGVVYLSYNTLPGWSQLMPLRYMLTQQAAVSGSNISGLETNIKNAIAYLERLIEADSSTTAISPSIKEKLDSLKKSDIRYVAHELFNRDWRPFYFSEVAEDLFESKLTYAASASLIDSIDYLSYTENQLSILGEISDTTFREGVRDFICNQQFRRDYWVRGARPLTAADQLEAFRSMNFVLCKPLEEIQLEMHTRLGRIELKESVYEPIIKAFDKTPLMEIDKLIDVISTEGIDDRTLFQAILILSDKGVIRPAWDSVNVESRAIASAKLNKKLINLSVNGTSIDWLSSPITGGAVRVDNIECLFLDALLLGKKKRNEWVSHAWRTFESQNKKLVKNGETLETPEANLMFLEEVAMKFESRRLPQFKRLRTI